MKKSKISHGALLILYALLLNFCTLYAHADEKTDLSAADLNFQLKNYESAIQIYLPLAEQGNSYAQTRMGLIYTNGYGLNKDLKLAYRWFEKSANQHDNEAEYYYATFLLNGYGVDKAPEKSLPWFEKSANQGNVDAQTSLGTMYMMGVGTQIDHEKSFFWNTKAANGGNSIAMYFLGQQYEKGLGTKSNMHEAAHWYELCAKAGRFYCEFEVGYFYHKGLGGYEINNKKATEWYLKAAEKGDVSAQYNLSTIYLEGTGSERNVPAAIDLLNKAAEQGYGLAQNKLGYMYNDLTLVPLSAGKITYANSKKLSEMWFKKAFSTWQADAKKQDLTAIEQLAIAYQYGLGTKKDYMAATNLHLKLLPLQNDDVIQRTLENLGYIYNAGLKNTSEALKAKATIDELAEKNDIAAIKFLSRFYNQYGDVGGGSSKLARFWYSKLAETGDISAQLALARLYTYKSPNEKGLDAQPNYPLALKWYKQVTQHDEYPNAQSELAKLYLSGQGGEKNEAAAIELLIRASSKGHSEAKLTLAQIYQQDKTNNIKALELYLDLVKNFHFGDWSTLFQTCAKNLADMYEIGQGTKPDASQAYMWRSLMIDNYNTYSARFTRPMITNGPMNSNVGTIIPSSSFRNIENDYPAGYLMEASNSDDEKRDIELETSKLNLLKNKMTAAEFKKALAMIDAWKASHKS